MPVANYSGVCNQSEPGGIGIPEGWLRYGLQIPRQLALIMRAESNAKGHSSVKVLGTMAIGLLLGMPEKARNALFFEIQRLSWQGGPDSLTPEAIWGAFEHVMKTIAKSEGDSPEWMVTRILDPELTPPPGQKASDKAKGREADKDRRKGAG